MVLVFAAFLAFQSCVSHNEVNRATVTIEPVKYFVDRLTGGNIETNVMVPMGASPATYSPTSNQIARLSSSKLYIGAGHLGFEKAWMGRIKELNEEMEIINLSDNVALIRGEEEVHGDHVHEGGVDPHIWMSPKVVLEFLPEIKEALIRNFPELQETITEKYPKLEKEIEKINQEYENACSQLRQRKFLIFHPALTYLARDYGLEQIPIEYEGKEPSPKKLRALIDRANSEDIRLIFIQAEFDKKNAEMVQEATRAQLAVINPLGYDWPESMKQILDLFESHLK